MTLLQNVLEKKFHKNYFIIAGLLLLWSKASFFIFVGWTFMISKVFNWSKNIFIGQKTSFNQSKSDIFNRLKTFCVVTNSLSAKFCEKQFLVVKKLLFFKNFRNHEISNKKRWKMKFLTDQKKILICQKKFLTSKKTVFDQLKKIIFLTT